MLRTITAALVAASLVAPALADDTSTPVKATPTFGPAVRLKAAGELIKVESPGYAFPAWYDIDGDGKPDLVVGQFRQGKMRVYKNEGDGKLAAGTWLQAGGKTAQVPGVW